LRNNINPTRFDHIPSLVKGSSGDLVHAIIETPRNTRLKYAFEPDFGVFRLKQVLPDGLQWPYDYGFIPQTLADDGDPLDVLVLTDFPTFTGCLIVCRCLGLIRLVKDGIENDRIIAAPARQKDVAQSADEFNDVADIPETLIAGICHFLVEYSAEEGHRIRSKGVKSRKRAAEALDSARSKYRKHGA
jgi:inorganic pyrophosphatase